jgi:hypothetical protein
MYLDLFGYGYQYHRYIDNIERAVACGYIDATYVIAVKRIGKRVLKMINNKLIKQIVFRRSRESHRKVFLEEEEE